MSSNPRAVLRATVKALLVALVALVLAVPLPGTDASAAPAKASPGQKIANGLRKSPVYVDPSYEQGLPPSQQRKLAQRIEKSGIPIRIVLVPLISGDSWGGDPDKMADVVRDRLGESPKREAVYMSISKSGDDFLSAREYPRDKHEAFWGVAAVGRQEDMDGRSLYAKFDRAIDIVEGGNGLKVYEKASKDLKHDSLADDKDGGGLSPLLIGGLAALGLAVLAALWLLVRRLRRAGGLSRGGAFTSPSSVFATAREADERDLRARAQREVLAFGEELSAHQSGEAPDAAALQLALDAYTAAGTVLDGAQGTPDLAGALALVHEGRGALARASEAASRPGTGRRPRKKPKSALPLCFFNPLHGPASGRIRWRPLGRREALHIAACDTCSSAVSGHRAPEALTDTHEGRTVPYFEVPAERSLWAATGYGSLGEVPLTERVIRGDFSRTRDGRDSRDREAQDAPD
ncbi:hypothetical protein OG533_23015 [Streptomyces sp. NBC_01186]|uniref:hypothetical protein n=1 Tax=Streptomyces sp. NBC_01186 TaxID=2903765 RepID=UPI002E118772|nr:hypothetical protein OG533_23015 [Streptomyces sp. NBC_01186]